MELPAHGAFHPACTACGGTCRRQRARPYGIVALSPTLGKTTFAEQDRLPGRRFAVIENLFRVEPVEDRQKLSIRSRPPLKQRVHKIDGALLRTSLRVPWVSLRAIPAHCVARIEAHVGWRQ